jgi:hypothetical protein
MMHIEDRPTLTLHAARTTGALADARRRDLAPVAQPTVHSTLYDLFMAVMAFYSASRDLAMPLALIQTLDQTFSTICTHRGEFLMLNLMVEIMERDVCAACDPGVCIALVRAANVLAHEKRAGHAL